MKTTILSILTVGCMFCSCKTQQMKTPDIHILNGEWRVTELNGTALNPEYNKQSLVLDTKDFRVSGNAGCNRLMGSFKHEKGQNIEFSQMATTRMACPDMKGEQQFLETLSQVRRFEHIQTRNGKTVVAFYGNDKKPLFLIEKE